MKDYSTRFESPVSDFVRALQDGGYPVVAVPYSRKAVKKIDSIEKAYALIVKYGSGLCQIAINEDGGNIEAKDCLGRMPDIAFRPSKRYTASEGRIVPQPCKNLEGFSLRNFSYALIVNGKGTKSCIENLADKLLV